ncbi:MAG: 2-dehydropantoate 2-reductase [Anaerolineae bacterium]
MRILVLGAGAIGGLLACQLALGGHDVTMVARSGLAEQIRRYGIVFVDDGRRHVVRNLAVVEGLEGFAADPWSRPFDWLALTVKAFDVPQAADEIRAAFPLPPPVVTFQNGVGSEDAAVDALGADHVVAASVTIPVSVPEPGHVVVRSSGGIGVAPYCDRRGRPTTARAADAVIQSMRAAKFRVRDYSDYRAMKWSKLLLNMTGNAIPAIVDMRPEAVFGVPALFHLEMDAQREAMAVMRALGVKIVNLPGQPAVLMLLGVRLLPDFILQPAMQRVALGGRGGKLPSLHIDLNSGRGQSEVQYLNGAVVRAGETVGVPTPINRVITDTLMALVTGRLGREDFYHDPQAFAARFRQALAT